MAATADEPALVGPHRPASRQADRASDLALAPALPEAREAAGDRVRVDQVRHEVAEEVPEAAEAQPWGFLKNWYANLIDVNQNVAMASSAEAMTSGERAATRRMLSKVPEVTALFWITKVLTTGMGEVTSDWLVHRLGPPPAVAIGFVVFVISLAAQMVTRRYIASVYWLAVVMVSVFGTMAADVLHVGLGIPYAVSTAFWAIVLTAVFLLWQRTEGTLSIHSIHTTRRELFYWAAVLSTFALGTAAGDLTAMTLHLGFLGSGLLFAGLICLPAIGYRFLGLSAIGTFWAAYVLTRPLGATFADWVGLPSWRGGLGIGTGTVSLVLTAAIVMCVGYLQITHEDVEPESI